MPRVRKIKNAKTPRPAVAVQSMQGISGYQPFQVRETAPSIQLYTALRENVPVIDAAILKIVRLCGGFTFTTGDSATDKALNRAMEGINVGGNQCGISAFMASYLSDLLTYGTAVAEMIYDDERLYALYPARLQDVEFCRAKNNLDVEFLVGGKKVPHPEKILFSALNPKAGEITGTSLLTGLPFIADILMKIFKTIGENWQHAGNIRYAVTYNPPADSALQADSAAEEIASAWQKAMSTDSVMDFVAVGDVKVSVIGADSKVLDSSVPVRELLEQIVAKTGMPPYMLGLSWSSTERMSSEQADALTTELEFYRRILNPVLAKIAGTYLHLQHIYLPVEVVWDDITLKDETGLAQARLYDARAQQILHSLAGE